MTVQFDAVGPNSSGQRNTSVSSMSWTHTPVGIPTAVSVQVSLTRSVVTTSIAVTYGGVSMANAVDIGDGAVTRAVIFGLPNPPAGAQTVVVTFGGTIDTAAAGSISVTGSDTTTCFSHVSGGSTNHNNNLPVDNPCTCVTGELVIDCASQHNFVGPWTPTSPQVQAWANTDGTSSYQPGIAPNVTMSERSSTGDFWSIVSASFKLPVVTPSVILMGQNLN